MSLDPETLRGLSLPLVEQTYTERDVILHALSVGFGPDETDARELDFVYEKELAVAPSFALTVCHRSIATLELGIDYRKVVHASQALALHAPLPAQGTLMCSSRVTGVWDLGEHKGALLEIERRLHEKRSDRLVATTRMGALCRGDGGFGGEPPPPRKSMPNSAAPDQVFRWQSSPGQAALYRLQGDTNPLHIDPERARLAGFERPILHGLATFGATVRAILAVVLGYAATRLEVIEGRFTAPFFPGETLQVEIWRNGPALQFQARAVERDVLVIRDGMACIAE
ncbi:Enoyl reductase domain of yeast-type FAS1 [Variovorax sp. SRS16]|uniref:MaoC/PaaZ C-terminal domain-containing protein n=1 Tax=Variovorax sp. SRS16 TaxID=282217 RepID=UPI0013184FEF|nr:MaoC/PaaZ C-terminal domain-containing protein [Variovorax sp. SRS16]VTU24421.1 Enoyl reductase domain of yeast-type FAS1 [Variovorax sp. SRS16]